MLLPNIVLKSGNLRLDQLMQLPHVNAMCGRGIIEQSITTLLPATHTHRVGSDYYYYKEAEAA